MILAVIVGLLALVGVVASIRTVSIDGYRRVPNVPISRQIDSTRP
jgi:hypothetical protein